MAITACEAKVSSSATCLSVKGLTSVRRMLIRPMAVPSRSSGVTRKVRIPGPIFTVREPLCFRLKVWNVDRPALEQSLVANRAPSQASPPWSTGWYRSEVRRQDHLIAFEKANSCIIGPAHPCRALRNRIQHRLNVRRRAGNDTQDFTRGGLLF